MSDIGHNISQYITISLNFKVVYITMIYEYSFIKPLKSEAIHETGLSGNVVTSFFPLIIFILLCFNVLSAVPRENRPADFLYIYIYIHTYKKAVVMFVIPRVCLKSKTVEQLCFTTLCSNDFAF